MSLKEQKKHLDLNYLGKEDTSHDTKQNTLNIHCPPRNHTGVSATGKIRPNAKLAIFWCVFLTKNTGRS